MIKVWPAPTSWHTLFVTLCMNARLESATSAGEKERKRKRLEQEEEEEEEEECRWACVGDGGGGDDENREWEETGEHARVHRKVAATAATTCLKDASLERKLLTDEGKLLRKPMPGNFFPFVCVLNLGAKYLTSVRKKQWKRNGIN
uniref:Uncharacterized protein n=1 Tax=Vespula pensylvanica TaxID=30213 RepID=A0A834P7U0_VESPE|nr:hypothetical protein H0235_004819 [Vespula pensylvanica]